MKYSDWYGCYANGWQQNDIIPEAFSHPAKFSKQLIRRIYGHLIDCGYVRPGDSVVDPFGGVALGALYAMRNGLHWRGLELEEKFVGLGCQNIELWNGRYAAHFPNWGTAELLQGDSRRLVETLATAGCVVSSPPYAESVNSSHSGIDWEKAGRPDRLKTEAPGIQGANNHQMKYGQTPGQLGAMKEGDVSAVISSPPYADAVSGQGEGPGARYDNVYHSADNATKKSSQNGYGRSDGNLGNMAAVVGSPPFEGTEASHAAKKYSNPEKVAEEMAEKYRNGTFSGHAASKEAILRGLLKANEQTYGSDPANIGNDTGETFWTAAREIVAQCYQVLRPGGVAVFVTGDFVRNKKRVYFGRQWLALCESVGFEPLEWIAAWKQEPGPIQTGIFEDKDLTIDRVSFFRRLANEKNPEAAILNEDVIIVQKPGGGGPGVDGVVSSPPFTSTLEHNPEKARAALDKWAYENGKRYTTNRTHTTDYGRSPGQLGSMKEGNPPETKDSGDRVNEEVMDLK